MNIPKTIIVTETEDIQATREALAEFMDEGRVMTEAEAAALRPCNLTIVARMLPTRPPYMPDC